MCVSSIGICGIQSLALALSANRNSYVNSILQLFSCADAMITATVVIFCAVGGRASVAKKCLVEDMGYTRVINAGGLCDLGIVITGLGYVAPGS